MKAIVFKKYGSPDSLRLQEVEKPVPKDNEVLVKVYAASINEWDWAILHGVPFVNRLTYGLFKPRMQILGADIAGQVETVGKNIKRWRRWVRFCKGCWAGCESNVNAIYSGDIWKGLF